MEPLRPTRRTLARTAVWTVPVVTVAATAPAFAASPCDCAGFSVAGFPAAATPVASGNGWTMLASGGGNAATGNDGFVAGTFKTDVDPPLIGTRTVTATLNICVTSGKTYTFSYPYTTVNGNSRKMTSVLQLAGATVVASTIDTTNSGQAGTRTFPWTSGTSGTIAMVFQHTVSGPVLGSTTGDDITIGKVTASCAA